MRSHREKCGWIVTGSFSQPLWFRERETLGRLEKMGASIAGVAGCRLTTAGGGGVLQSPGNKVRKVWEKRWHGGSHNEKDAQAVAALSGWRWAIQKCTVSPEQFGGKSRPHSLSMGVYFDILLVQNLRVQWPHYVVLKRQISAGKRPKGKGVVILNIFRYLQEGHLQQNKLATTTK